jgi:hypothetical protein
VAENTVVKDQLTDAMVEVGAELTRKLDEAGVLTEAALWLAMASTFRGVARLLSKAG